MAIRRGMIALSMPREIRTPITRQVRTQIKRADLTGDRCSNFSGHTESNHATPDSHAATCLPRFRDRAGLEPPKYSRMLESSQSLGDKMTLSIPIPVVPIKLTIGKEKKE